MATQTYEFKAKSVDDAIDEGLQTLGVTRDKVDIEIVNKGSRGLFGIGSEPALIRISLRAALPDEAATPTKVVDVPVDSHPTPQAATQVGDTPKPETTATVAAAQPMAESPALHHTPDDSSAVADYDDELDDSAIDDEIDEGQMDPDTVLSTLAADMLDEMIHLMGFDAQVIPSWQEEDDDDFETDNEDSPRGSRQYLLLDVEGTDLGALIGRRGETLDDIQYLLRLMVNQKIHQWKNIVIDVEHYKSRRVNQVTQLAERMAEQVSRTGKAISLEPMPANERRIVHMVLRNHPEVYTESYGEGSRRKVHIFASE